MDSGLEAVRFATLRRSVRRAAIGIAVAGAAFLGCEAFGVMPGGNVVVESRDASTAGLPCLGTCVPDPGSAQADCSVSTRGITKLPIVTFDDPDSMGDFSAQDFYVYTDGTAVAMNVYGSAPNLLAMVAGYVPKTQIDGYCGAGNAVLHVVGGYLPDIDTSGGCLPVPSESKPSAFRAWGGGMGIPMQKLNNSDGLGDAQKGLCGPQPNGGPPPHPELCPPATEEYAVRVGALDVSEFDGISFWGRRGPNGQAGIGVTIGDRFTDDDISYLTYRNDPTAPRHCERVKECSCADLTQCEFADPGAFNINSSVCGPDQPGYYCAGALAADGGGLAFQAINGQGTTFYCSGSPLSPDAAPYQNECNQPYAAYPNDVFHFPDGGTVTLPNGTSALGDPAFFNRPCTPHTRADGYGASFCFDPATDPPPANPTELCGDHWMKMVTLGTDWQFFKVRFTDLRQQGFAKKSELLDLHAVSVVRFTWTAGWIDYWIDEVSFYRDSP
ncbi:MAG: hypothetical protein WBY94_14630 [Polyangiaceae bacterium]